MGGAWDTICDVFDACDPLSSRATESCGFKEDAYVQMSIHFYYTMQLTITKKVEFMYF